MKTQQEWQQAKSYLDDVIGQYQEIGSMPGVYVGFALERVLKPLLVRFESGERTDELYESMLNVE